MGKEHNERREKEGKYGMMVAFAVTAAGCFSINVAIVVDVDVKCGSRGSFHSNSVLSAESKSGQTE